ncbi:MAG: hypothetical protein WAN72_02150 [Candidatus Acidiferrales bacterium]
MPRSKRPKKVRPAMLSVPDSLACAQLTPDMENLEEKTVTYYDNLTAAEMAEQFDWGRVGAASLLPSGASRRF